MIFLKWVALMIFMAVVWFLCSRKPQDKESE